MRRERRERIRVRGHHVRPHTSHTKTGRRVHVRGYRAKGSVQYRDEPYPRGERLGIRSKHHPGYKASYSPAENVDIGHRAAVRRGQVMPYLHVEKELAWQGLLHRRTDPSASRSFYAAARLARKKHEDSRNGECGRRCEHTHYA